MKKKPSEKRHTFIINNGRKINILKLPGFIQSSNLLLYLSCNNCFILRFDKILKSFGRYPTIFMLNWLVQCFLVLHSCCFWMYSRKNQLKNFNLCKETVENAVLILCNISPESYVGNSTLKISCVKSHNFFSCDAKSLYFLWEKCVSCDFTRENFPRVMKNYTIFQVNECMRK